MKPTGASLTSSLLVSAVIFLLAIRYLLASTTVQAQQGVRRGYYRRKINVFQMMRVKSTMKMSGRYYKYEGRMYRGRYYAGMTMMGKDRAKDKRDSRNEESAMTSYKGKGVVAARIMNYYYYYGKGLAKGKGAVPRKFPPSSPTFFKPDPQPLTSTPTFSPMSSPTVSPSASMPITTSPTKSPSDVSPGMGPTDTPATALSTTPFPSSTPSQSPTFLVLYEEDFETPNQDPIPLDTGCTEIAQQPTGSGENDHVNRQYGDTTRGIVFSQTFTVETFLLGSTQSTTQMPYEPSDERGGNYAIGMLSGIDDGSGNQQNDRVSLGFQLQGRRYVNVTLDVASVGFDGICQAIDPRASSLRLRLLDDPRQTVPVSASVENRELAMADISVSGGEDANDILWTRATVTLDGQFANQNGFIAINWDATQGTYLIFDNVRIIAFG